MTNYVREEVIKKTVPDLLDGESVPVFLKECRKYSDKPFKLTIVFVNGIRIKVSAVHLPFEKDGRLVGLLAFYNFT